jgi:hypothetical protein
MDIILIKHSQNVPVDSITMILNQKKQFVQKLVVVVAGSPRGTSGLNAALKLFDCFVFPSVFFDFFVFPFVLGLIDVILARGEGEGERQGQG